MADSPDYQRIDASEQADCPDYRGISPDLIAAVQLRRALGADSGGNQLVEVPLHHPVELVEREVDAVVGDPVLFEVVGPDLLRAVAAPHHSAPLGADRLLLLGELHLVEARAQDAHG